MNSRIFVKKVQITDSRQRVYKVRSMNFADCFNIAEFIKIP